jgi:hypothetical protein
MKIKRIPTPDMQRWPVNSTQFLFPTIAVKGFPGHTRHLILVFWRWRVDFEIRSNISDEVTPEVAKSKHAGR